MAVLGLVSAELGFSQEGVWGCTFTSPQNSLRGLLSALCPLPQALSSWFRDLSMAWKDTELRPHGSVDPFQGCGRSSFPEVWAGLRPGVWAWLPSRGCGRGFLQEFCLVLGIKGVGEALQDQ